jgi:hypothetical protein
MRRLFAALTLCISLLFPVTLPIRAQQATVGKKDNQTQTVYITRSGKKYHLDGCRYLAAGKTAISLRDAKAKGHTACKFVTRQIDPGRYGTAVFQLARIR